MEMDRLRAFIGQCEEEEEGLQQIEQLRDRIEQRVSAMHTPNMRKVINGTGNDPSTPI